MMRLKSVLLLQLWYLSVSTSSNVIPKHFTLLNKSGGKLQILWVNPKGEHVPFSNVYNGARLAIDTYVNHSFVLRQTKDSTQESRINYITVKDNYDDVIYVREDLEIVDNLYEGSNETSGDVVSSLKSLCVESDSLTLDDILECYEEELTPIFEENNKELSREAKDRIHLSNMLEEYTCQDNELPSSNKGPLRPWLYNGTLRDVRILHERHDSQIHLIPNFITEDECKAIEEAAKRDLHRGAVANGNGGSRLSENRKAWQAGVPVPWEREDDGDFIASYARRMYDYANFASGYGMTVDGQEDIMSIQYFGQDGEHPKGSSYTPETPDRYMPHCDGSCEGLPHRKGARVATMVSYCTVPKRGGSTNFKNADVHVKPELGAAVFFSYMDPVTKKMDTGWTTHSGCPVVEGTKRIVVHWMRVGVSTEEPWDSLNTLNIPKRMLEDES